MFEWLLGYSQIFGNVETHKLVQPAMLTQVSTSIFRNLTLLLLISKNKHNRKSHF